MCHLDVGSQAVFVRKNFIAEVARESLSILAVVESFMRSEMIFGPKSRWANFTWEWAVLAIFMFVSNVILEFFFRFEVEDALKQKKVLFKL